MCDWIFFYLQHFKWSSGKSWTNERMCLCFRVIQPNFIETHRNVERLEDVRCSYPCNKLWVSAKGVKKRKLVFANRHEPVTQYGISLLQTGHSASVCPVPVLGHLVLGAWELSVRLHALQLSRTSCRTSVAYLSDGSCLQDQIGN